MSKFLKFFSKNPQDNLIQKVVKTLNNGGLIIYPSDTSYSLGYNIFDVKAMKKLAQIKGVKLEKSNFSIICNSISQLSEFSKPIDTASFRLLKYHLPGPFTFILKANRKKLPSAYKEQKTIGIRVPNHSIPQLIVSKLGNPIASTTIWKDNDDVIQHNITDPKFITKKYNHLINIVIDSGYSDNKESTIVDLTQGKPKIIKEGKGNLKY